MQSTDPASAEAPNAPDTATQCDWSEQALKSRQTEIQALVDIGCCALCVLRHLGCHDRFVYTRERVVLNKQLGITGVSDSHETAMPQPSPVCTTCFGFLDLCTDPKFSDIVASTTLSSGRDFNEYSLTITYPISVLIREYAVWYHLTHHCGIKHEEMSLKKFVLDIKDVAKWILGPRVTEKLHTRFKPQAKFRVNIELTHQETETETKFLANQQNQSARKSRYRPTAPSLTTAAPIIDALPFEQFIKNCACPPAKVAKMISYTITFNHESLYITGRYLKYCTKLSQTPWLLEGPKRHDCSIEELIVNVIENSFKACGHKFMASGREDVDVRMLGNGRPFVIEFLNPSKPFHTVEEYAEMQAKINESTKRIQVCHLQETSEALIWTSRVLSEADLLPIRSIKDLVVAQKTPIRVLHRRALATRPKTIHIADFEKLDSPHFFILKVTTEAGTYIKEFVHGDLGRTVPNIGSILGCDADILQLDVMSVDLDFPPPIRPVPLLPHSFVIPETVRVQDFRASEEDC